MPCAATTFLCLSTRLVLFALVQLFDFLKIVLLVFLILLASPSHTRLTYISCLPADNNGDDQAFILALSNTGTSVKRDKTGRTFTAQKRRE